MIEFSHDEFDSFFKRAGSKASFSPDQAPAFRQQLNDLLDALVATDDETLLAA